MNDTITQREEELFDAARQISDPAKRTAFLDFSCTKDPTLRRRIVDLLATHEQADAFFQESAALVSGVGVPGPPARGGLLGTEESHPDLSGEEAVGARIGRYKLLEKIGEGGCGVVYLAEQEEPVRRRVALKIIRLGMETKSVIARFEAERQALAMMDHPNIARVFDAGETERGSPYFVMEHVRGVRITTYCDQNRLPIRQRLNLFIQICHAIQHAHQKGIIHGDIKPSNIMVAMHDGVPVPKVIDFGISKATEARLTDRVPFAAYAQLIGTPAYMSPEQVEMDGLDVDTRSDIFSLGVLLYELLTGRTPFNGKELLESGFDEMRRLLLECEPARPSVRLHELEREALGQTATARQTTGPRLISLVRGDLDSIVIKALEKDRQRRYETANGLALDVERNLGHEPVLARPPAWYYRLHKLVRRNRGVFVAVSAVGLALVFGTGVSTWLFLKERDARHRAVAAEQQQARLRHAAEIREKVTQAAYFVSQERYAEADELLRQLDLNEATLEGAAVYRSVGEWHAINNRWKQAADRFDVLLKVNQLDGSDVSSLDYLERGPALIEMGDLNGYERFRREAIARFADSSNRFVDRIVKISLLTPAHDALLASLHAHVENTTKAWAAAAEDGDVFTAAWRAMSLALYEYRRGDHRAAVRWAETCLSYPGANAPLIATARMIRGMARHQLGYFEDARTDLMAGRDIVEHKFKTGLDRGTPVQGFWFDWVFARILVRECTALVEGPPGRG